MAAQTIKREENSKALYLHFGSIETLITQTSLPGLSIYGAASETSLGADTKTTCNDNIRYLPGVIPSSKKRNWYLSFKWVVIVKRRAPFILKCLICSLLRGFSQDSRTDQGETSTTLKCGIAFGEAFAPES